jgi:hypothetical protein
MRQDRLDRIARRAKFLLRRSQDSQAEMTWAERRLEEQALWHGNAPSDRGDLRACGRGRGDRQESRLG